MTGFLIGKRRGDDMRVQRHNKWEKAILLTFMLMPTLLITVTLDNDFWFLLNQGRYIVHNGFPVAEPFTIHQGLSFTIQQWLFDVLIYFLYTVFGKIGVLVLMFTAALVTLFLIYRLCMLLSGQKYYLSVVVTTICYLLLCIWFFVSRPQILTYVILLTELSCLEHYVRGKNWKLLLPLPLLSLLQINLHASMWWLLFAFLAPYLLETVKINKFSINRDPLPKTGLYVIAGCMLLAGFINPYGYRAIGYIFGAFGNDTINSSILEMAVPDVKTGVGAVYFLVILVLVLCYALNRGGSTKLRYVLLTLGSTLLSLMSVKSIPYFLFGAMLPLCYQLKNVAHRLHFHMGKSKFVPKALVAFLVLVCGYAIFVTFHDYDATKDYPTTKTALEHLQNCESTDEIVLYTSFYDGGYAEYCGFRAYIDARAEVFLESTNGKKDIFEEYMQLQRGELHYREFLDQYGFTHMLVTPSDTLEVYLSRDDGFDVYYEDENCKIYVPRTG